MGRTIQSEFKAGELKPEVLLLEKETIKIKEIPEEVEELSSKFDDFGIKNTTANFIKKSRSDIATETKERNQKRVKDDGLQLLMKIMFPFKIVPYKVIHEIANDYNLAISSLSYYGKPIQEENIEELQIFKDLMAEKRESFKPVSFPKAHRFTFAGAHFDSVEDIDFSNYFNIVAPKGHFDFKGDNTLTIGREVKRHEKSPGFKPNLKFKIPELEDPIIIAPFEFLGKLYAFVVTAWDKVGDDDRIRSMIK